MWLDETISPSASKSGLDPGLEARVGAQQVRVALRLPAEAEVLAHRDVRGAEGADEHVVDEVLGRHRRELAVERDDHELLDAEAGDELGLALDRRQQARRAARDDRLRVRVERQHGVGAADDRAVAEVDAVEGADGHPARARLDVGQARDLHARNPTVGLSRPPSRGSATAIGPSVVDEQHVLGAGRSRRPRPRRRARRASSRPREAQRRPHLDERVAEATTRAGSACRPRTGRSTRAAVLAVRVAEVGDERAHVRPGRAGDDSRPAAGRASAPRKRVTVTVRSGIHDLLPAPASRVRALPADP
jgi:hypothetical protein